MLTPCLILKNREFQENSLIITVFHPQLGAQEFLARGGKRIAAKLTPSLQPLRMVSLWVAPTRSEKPIIREIEVCQDLTPAYGLGLKLSLRIVSLLSQAVQPHLEATILFGQVVDMLRRISIAQLSLTELRKIWIQFELVLLAFLGVRPSPEHLQSKHVNEIARSLERRIHHFLSA